MKPINVGIVGIGRIAAALEKDKKRYKPCTHLGSLVALKKEGKPIKLVAACDIREEAFFNIPTEFQSAKKYFSWQEMMNHHDDMDLLVIASDTYTHYEILKKALQRNIPKIVVEKPVCLLPKEAKKLKKVYARSTSKVWVHYERRYRKAYRQLKDILQTSSYTSFRGLLVLPQQNLFRTGKKEGALLHDTTHLLDLCFYLFGDLVRKKQVVSQNACRYFLEFEKASGILETILHKKLFHFELEVLTEKTRYRIGNGFSNQEAVVESPLYENFFSLKEAELFTHENFTQEDNPYLNLYRNVIHENLEQEGWRKTPPTLEKVGGNLSQPSRYKDVPPSRTKLKIWCGMRAKSGFAGFLRLSLAGHGCSGQASLERDSFLDALENVLVLSR
ncbi:MAG: gfo/Idh/MocA family oxidoreductase [Candidatus Hydrogenedentota bacterium]|nr:MAG: gfo/Idh/MocA family oxidoreductase [Candidatus Hydrogenedentota bacterium]